MAILWKVEYDWRVRSSDSRLLSSWWNDTEYMRDFQYARKFVGHLIKDSSRPGSVVQYRNIMIKHRSSASEQWRIVKRWQ